MIDLTKSSTVSANPSILIGEVKRRCEKQWVSCQKIRPDKLHPPSTNWHLVLPRRFRERRALAIFAWYAPEWLSFELLLSLAGLPEDLDFEHGGLSRSIELRLLCESREIMEAYLENLISSRHLFGTILQEDLRNALINLQIVEETRRSPRRSNRRKGYRDKGYRRPPHRWQPSHDISLTELQVLREIKRDLVSIFSQLFIRKLVGH